MSLEVVRAPGELRAACDGARGRGARVGLVPTMGALHPGHLSLVEAARAAGADWLAVTIFVNPLQFGEGEDLDRYPRTFEADRAACEAAGVDLIFSPEPGAMYPEGFQTQVEVTGVTRPLEGAHRPGHFRGVTTVVTKLLNLAGPCAAAFGRKDYQQLATIRRMVRDLDMPIEVLGAPIIREPDGLALSSRNRYLDPDQRARALGLVSGLRRAWDAFDEGERDAGTLRDLAAGPAEAAFDRVDYVAIADPDSFEPLTGTISERALVAAAAHLGGTRLIDNVELGVDPKP